MRVDDIYAGLATAYQTGQSLASIIPSGIRQLPRVDHPAVYDPLLELTQALYRLTHQHPALFRYMKRGVNFFDYQHSGIAAWRFDPLEPRHIFGFDMGRASKSQWNIAFTIRSDGQHYARVGVGFDVKNNSQAHLDFARYSHEVSGRSTSFDALMAGLLNTSHGETDGSDQQPINAAWLTAQKPREWIFAGAYVPVAHTAAWTTSQFADNALGIFEQFATAGFAPYKRGWPG
jgi:hypothetical protein